MVTFTGVSNKKRGWHTNDHPGSIGTNQMCIITGSNINSTIKLFRR